MSLAMSHKLIFKLRVVLSVMSKVLQGDQGYGSNECTASFDKK